MTYSVIAIDPQDGSIGYAAQSHFFGLGAVVGRAEAGVGAVVSQAFANLDWPHRGIDLLRSGVSPADVVQSLVADDTLAEYRQLMVMDAQGRHAAHTGGLCAPQVSYAADGVSSAAGNMLASPSTASAMLVDPSAENSLARRLVAALRAAEATGGDARGSQSACLKVVSGKRSDSPWREVLVDIRVDDHPDPVTEMERILPLYEGSSVVAAAMFTPPLIIGDHRDIEPGQAAEMLERLAEASLKLGDNREADLWSAVIQLRAGHDAAGRESIARLTSSWPRIAEFVVGLEDAGIIPSRPVR